MRSISTIPSPSTNTIRFLCISTVGVPWKTQGLSPSMTCIFSRTKCRWRGCWDWLLLFRMSWRITGLEIWWQWGGGTISGWTRLSPPSSPTGSSRSWRMISRLSATSRLCQLFSLEKAGVTTRTRWLPPILSAARSSTPALLIPFSMELPTPKERPQWNNFSISWGRKTSEKLWASISTNTNGKMQQLMTF